MSSDPQFDPMARRTLAAIVFTDVANASQLMGENEEHTLELVRRDLEIIKGLCQKHSGRVLKFTGDGLLMYFTSAVQAVACALEVQTGMAERAKVLPVADVLMHRIGIHLGDVFVSDSDVMGDGVNIAARLQSEAEPGGICISETVYDVVKNRLALKATYLGPRELKNIKDAVPVYQIIIDAAMGGGKVRALRHKMAPGVKRWMWIISSLLGVLLVATGVVVYFQFFRGDRGGSLSGGMAAIQAAAKNDPVLAKILAARPGFIPRYDFAGMMNWMEKNGLKDHPFYARYSKLKDLKQTVFTTLMLTGANDPLILETDTPQGPQSSRIWASGAGTYILQDSAGQRELRLEEFTPGLFQNVVSTMLRKNPGLSRSTKHREAQQILTEELATTK